MFNALFTAATFIVRIFQIAYRAAIIASFFFPVAIAHLRLVAARLVLAALSAYDMGANCRAYLENDLARSFASFLNEFCYFVNPELAPAAAPINYFPATEEVATIEFAPCCDPWDLAIGEVAIASSVPANNIKPLLLLPPARDNSSPLSDLSIRQLKKRASAAKIRNYNVMTKAQLVEALTA